MNVTNEWHQKINPQNGSNNEHETTSRIFHPMEVWLSYATLHHHGWPNQPQVQYQQQEIFERASTTTTTCRPISATTAAGQYQQQQPQQQIGNHPCHHHYIC